MDVFITSKLINETLAYSEYARPLELPAIAKHEVMRVPRVL